MKKSQVLVQLLQAYKWMKSETKKAEILLLTSKIDFQLSPISQLFQSSPVWVILKLFNCTDCLSKRALERKRGNIRRNAVSHALPKALFDSVAPPSALLGLLLPMSDSILLSREVDIVE